MVTIAFNSNTVGAFRRTETIKTWSETVSVITQ